MVADLPTRELITNILASRKPVKEEDSSEGVSEEEIEPKQKEEPKKPEVQKKPPPTQFQEPDANSLLDAFGF